MYPTGYIGRQGTPLTHGMLYVFESININQRSHKSHLLYI